MDIAATIRQLYAPVQPTVKVTDEDVVYREWMPDPQLKSFIYCYWELKTMQALSEPFHYRAVTDGCIDIALDLNTPQNSYVMGFCCKYTDIPLSNHFHYVGVRFLPAMFPQIFKINAAELSNHYEKLELVVPDTAQFIVNTFVPNDGFLQIKTNFDTYFTKVLSKTTFNFDPRLYEAIHLILKNQGVLNIETDLNTGISPRQLRRLFEFYVGDSAKTFSQVVRFQNVLRTELSSENLLNNKLFFDMGYYDQAHFIKEFRNFYGVTPSRAFRK